MRRVTFMQICARLAPVCSSPNILMAGVMIAVAAQLARLWWVSPEHRIAQFLGAVNRRDYQRALCLASTTEVCELRLDSRRLGLAVADAVSGPRFTLWRGRQVRYRLPQRAYNRAFRLAIRDEAGQVLRDRRGRVVEPFVVAYNTRAGWKVGISRFLVSVVSAQDRASAQARVLMLWSRYDLAPRVFLPEDGSWEAIPQPRTLMHRVRSEP